MSNLEVELEHEEGVLYFSYLTLCYSNLRGRLASLKQIYYFFFKCFKELIYKMVSYTFKSYRQLSKSIELTSSEPIRIAKKRLRQDYVKELN